ncbi:MAG: hypothetical protein H7Z17_21015, partial [Fuerstia sp.]|nr:hypothetical protein [Fuerstiella sp.]
MSADNSARNTTAISAIFADEHIAESTLSVHQSASAMSPQQRFEYLARWVMLNDQLVFECVLESTNQRHFGFFYDSDH